jgi:predicted nucleic acid-binding protein
VTVVVDASVAIKWFLEEDGSEAARRLLADELLIAPDFLVLECANIFWAAVSRGRLTSERAGTALAAIQALPVQWLPMRDYGSAAQALAFELSHPVYDCLYLAIALAQRAMMVTADRAFTEAVARHGVHAHAVRLLEQA